MYKHMFYISAHIFLKPVSLFIVGCFIIGLSSCSKSGDTPRSSNDSVLVSLLTQASSYDETGMKTSQTMFSYSRFGVVEKIWQWDGTSTYNADSNLYVFNLDRKSGIPVSYTESILNGGASRQFNNIDLQYANNLLSRSVLTPADYSSRDITYVQTPDLITNRAFGKMIDDSIEFKDGNLSKFTTYKYGYPSINKFYYSTHRNPYYHKAWKPFAALFINKEFLGSHFNDLWFFIDPLSEKLPDSIAFKNFYLGGQFTQGTYAFTWQTFNEDDLPLTGFWISTTDIYYSAGFYSSTELYRNSLRFEYEKVWIYQ